MREVSDVEDRPLSKRKPGKQGTPKPAAGSSRAAGAASGPMDVGLLEQIVQLMSANDLNTVDLRDGGKRVVLKRGANVIQYVAGAPGYAPPLAPSTAAPASQPQAGASGSSSGAAADADAKLTPIKSPMVGTFYAAPKQGEKPYVSVGSVVNEETDVCIIEAMKVFNVIKAETRGTIAKILVTNGQTVEFGQTLFLVKPS